MGLKNWRPFLSEEQSKEVEWHFLNLGADTAGFREGYSNLTKKQTFEVVLCTDEINNCVLIEFSELIEAYRLIVDQRLKEEVSTGVIQSKSPFFLDLCDPEKVIEVIRKCFFANQIQQGTKFQVSELLISHFFEGNKEFWGQNYLELTGRFSEKFLEPLISWRYNVAMRNKSKKIWLEFEHDPSLSIGLSIVFINGITGEVVQMKEYTEAQFESGLEIEYQKNIDYLGFSLKASGEGKLRVGALHYRDSRGKFGEYIPGGHKIFDKKKQEIYYYLNPGNLTPPLTVYFSGYRTAEGFEGFQMMKKMGQPFLLFTDPRLEGGAFYLGTPHLEKQVIEVIEKSLNVLGFDHHQLVLSGLSMGTFGALYYGSRLKPHTIVIGKPLVNLGTMAVNSKLVRPGQFETSLDLLCLTYKEISADSISLLNQRFWAYFDEADFSETKFKVAYMENDDYDSEAYHDLLEHLLNQKTTIISKGIPGRHNDNSSAINQWFLTQYHETLSKDFSLNGSKKTGSSGVNLEREEGNRCILK